MTARFVFGCGLDFSIVESPYFKALVKKLRPACEVISLDDLTSKLLFKLHDDVICTQAKILDSQDGTLMITTREKSAEMPETVFAIATVRTNEGENSVYLGSRESNPHQEAQAQLSLQSDVMLDAILLAKTKYNLNIYAVLLGTKLMENDLCKDDDMWYIIDNEWLINAVADDIEDKSLSCKLTTILEQFESDSVDEKIKQFGGTSLLHDTDNCWIALSKQYSSYLDNLTLLKQIAADGSLDLGEKIVILFDSQFEHELKQFVNVFNALHELSELCKDSKKTLADTTESWLVFEALCTKLGLKVRHRSDIFTPQALAANFFHPQYQGHLFMSEDDDDKHKLQRLTQFAVQSLSGKGLEGYAAYKNREGIFRTLLQKKVPCWKTFWNTAGVYYPELSCLARKLLKIPVKTLKLDLTDISTDQLTPNRSKKFQAVYHHLRLHEIDADNEPV